MHVHPAVSDVRLGPVPLRVPLSDPHAIGQQCHLLPRHGSGRVGLPDEREHGLLKLQVMVRVLGNQERSLGAVRANAPFVEPPMFSHERLQASRISLVHPVFQHRVPEGPDQSGHALEPAGSRESAKCRRIV